MSVQKWVVDPSHSEVSFKVKHLMITTVTGYFRSFNVEVETEGDNFNAAKKIEFTAEVDSIDTNDEQRNGHLKSADFFDGDRVKQIKFSGVKYEGNGEDGKLTGELTIKDVTKTVTLDVEYGGIIIDGYGQTKAGFTVTGKISRKDFGLTWSAVTEAGSIVVSDDVRINVELQLIKQA
ncbi:MAG TPA: YceI family protein [Sphingobacteriaceae bacterium]|nr:YceI family protein [Sphingobacteriaceae bacterium]